MSKLMVIPALEHAPFDDVIAAHRAQFGCRPEMLFVSLSEYKRFASAQFDWLDGLDGCAVDVRLTHPYFLNGNFTYGAVLLVCLEILEDADCQIIAGDKQQLKIIRAVTKQAEVALWS